MRYIDPKVKSLVRGGYTGSVAAAEAGIAERQKARQGMKDTMRKVVEAVKKPFRKTVVTVNNKRY